MNHKAFTLIELLVVVLIIGILSAIALPQYTQAVEKSRAAEALTNIGSFKRAVDIWKLANPDVCCRGFTGDGEGFGELDIDIPEDWVKGTSGQSEGSIDYKSCSKNFCYGIDARDRVSAYRANSSTYRYGISYEFGSGSYLCHAYTEADLKLCKSLSNIQNIDSSL